MNDVRRRLTLVAGCCLSLAVVAGAQGQKKHYEKENFKLHLQCSFQEDGKPKVLEVPLNLLSSMIPCEPDQVVNLPDGWPVIHVKEYLPQAELVQVVVPDESRASPPVMELSFVGPKRRYKRCLAADPRGRDTLLSLIGRWRYLAVEDTAGRNRLFKRFETEFTRAPTLTVSAKSGGASTVIGAKAGASGRIERPNCAVRVKAFFPHFNLDPKSNEPTNLSDRRLNPATLVEVEWDGNREELWIFSAYRDVHLGKAERLPVTISLDCPREQPQQRPDFALITVNRSAHEVWMRHKGKIETRPLVEETSVAIPGSPYSFTIAQFAPSATVREDYHLETGIKGAVPALKIVVVAPDRAKVSRWLEFRQPRVFATEKGPLTVVVEGRRTGGTSKSKPHSPRK